MTILGISTTTSPTDDSEVTISFQSLTTTGSTTTEEYVTTEGPIVTESKCNSSPCKNGARCSDITNDYFCACPKKDGSDGPIPLFYGKDCSMGIANKIYYAHYILS